MSNELTETTLTILRPLWERNRDLCDLIAWAVREGHPWDEVVHLWRPLRPGAMAWRTYRAAWAAQRG